jgi:quinol monooxygenase YgiN
MSKQVEVVVEWTINPGKFTAFKNLAEAATKAVRENEPGASRYVWYYAKDQKKCILTEAYADSGTFMMHLKNVWPILTELFKVGATTRFEVLGPLSEEAEQTVRENGGKQFEYGTGVDR